MKPIFRCSPLVVVLKGTAAAAVKQYHRVPRVVVMTPTGKCPIYRSRAYNIYDKPILYTMFHTVFYVLYTLYCILDTLHHILSIYCILHKTCHMLRNFYLHPKTLPAS